MNTISKTVMSLSAFILLTSHSHGQLTYPFGHADIGIAYEGGDWDPHFHDEETGLEYEPSEVVIFGSEANSANFKLAAPGTGPFAFLGASGADVFIFPQVEDSGLPFLGIAAEEVDPSDFVGDITINLTGLSGPGSFFLYQTDGFGSPTVFFDSSDGIDASDVLTIGIGSHAHYNWAFTGEGIYSVTMTASGILNDGFDTFSASAPATFTFGVNQVPEPSAYALIAGILVLGICAQRRRRIGG